MMKKDVGMISRFFMLCSAVVFSITLVCGIASAGLTADFSVSDECGLLGLEYPDGDTLTLNDATTTTDGETVVSWSWSTTNGYSSYSQYPDPISVTGPDSFDVTLTVTGSHSSVSFKTKTVTIFNDPWIIANFSHIVEYDQDPLWVRFIDQSEASGHNIINWYWNISGDKYDDQMPNVTLPDGVHDVILVIVTDHGEYARVTKSIGINSLKSDKSPVADFDAKEKEVMMGERVNFTDKSLNHPNSWMWDFGDGVKSNLQTPSHVYHYPGVFSVGLNVSNNAGNDGIVKKDFIKVLAPEPIVNVSANPKSGNFPLTVQFTTYATFKGMDYVKASDLIKEWRWDFGDGSPIFPAPGLANAQNVSYVYSKPGSYNPKVTCIPYYGENGENSSIIIKVGPSPYADFYWIYQNYTPSAGYYYKFFDRSYDATSYLWNFMDGSVPSTEMNPVHLFKEPGEYEVALNVSGPDGSDDVTKNVVVVAGYTQPPTTEPTPTPTPTPDPDYKADFAWEKIGTKTYQFTDKSSPSTIKWKWSFGDGTFSSEQNPVHVYPFTNRYYMVHLSVSDGTDTGSIERGLYSL